MAHSFGIIQEKNFLEKVQIPILNTLLYYLLKKIFTASFLHHSLDFSHTFIFSASFSSYCNQQSFFTSLKNNQFDTQKQELLCNSSEQLKMKERYSRKRSNFSMAFHQSEYISSDVHHEKYTSLQRQAFELGLAETHLLHHQQSCIFFFTFPSYFGMRYD